MSWVWNHKPASRKDARTNSIYAEPDWNAPLPEDKPSRLEYLYAWERRCRGYAIAPYPVALEPSFLPYEPDDPHGQLHLAHTPPLPLPAQVQLSHLSLHFPVEQKITPANTHGFLSALSGLHHPIAFEIVAGREEITYQLTATKPEAGNVRSAAQMHWPHAEIAPSEDILRREAQRCCKDEDHWRRTSSFVVEFGLLHFAYLPLRVFESFTVDPLSGVLAGLGQLEDGETAGLQILLSPANRRWNEALLQVAGEFEDGEQNAPRFGARSFGKYPFESETMRAARDKLAHPLFAVVLRVFALSASGQGAAFALCKKIGGALGAFTSANENGLIALSNNDPHSLHPHSFYPDEVHLEDVFERRSHRPGLLLSLPELAGVVHPPAETLQHPRLVRLDPHAHPLPEHLLQAQGATLGLHPYRREVQEVVWPDAYRNRHAYILGATRMGKSTLLLNLIIQDIEAGKGLCLIDPHGDLALDVLARVPKERTEDVLYLDLSDTEYPLALGLLEAGDEYERRLLASDLLSVLHRLFASSWGDRLEHILRHAILTLLAASRSNANVRDECSYTSAYTLRDIRALLANKAFRKQVVDQLDDPDLRNFWQSEFLGYNSSTFSPLYNKLGLLLSSPLVRNIVSQQESKLSFPELIQNKEVLLVNLASSRIGGDNAHFLGALLISKLQIAAMASLRLPQHQRTPFTLYVDEFQNFVVSSFQTILSEAGKAGLSLVMANQFLEQLSAPLQTAILSNAGTLCSFRVSSDSGRLLEKEFAGRFTAKEMVSLDRGEAIVRVGSAQDSFAIGTLPPPEVPYDPSLSTVVANTIRELSRERLCRPRAEVEAELAEEAARQAELLAAEEEAEKQAKEKEKQEKVQEKETAKEAKQQEKLRVRTEAGQGKKKIGSRSQPTESQDQIAHHPIDAGVTEEPMDVYSSDYYADGINVADEATPPSPVDEFHRDEQVYTDQEGLTDKEVLIDQETVATSEPLEPECFGVEDVMEDGMETIGESIA